MRDAVNDPVNDPVNDDVLRADDLCVRFGRTQALTDVSLAIPNDRVTVILGRNGAGKSTLLRVALGVVKPRAGTIRVLSRDPFKHSTAVRQRIGYVPDVPDVPDWMTPVELFRFLKPHYPVFDVDRAIDLLRRLQVSTDTRFSQLSRGQGMLAMLAAAIAPEPELLLLDEPFGGLDPLAREEILRAVIEELRDRGRAVVLTTHDLEVTSRIADRVVVMDQGRVTWQGEVDALEEQRSGPQSLPSLLKDRLAASREVEVAR